MTRWHIGTLTGDVHTGVRDVLRPDFVPIGPLDPSGRGETQR
jgi:hypothetical protein